MDRRRKADGVNLSEQLDPFDVDGVRVNIANAPPVYAPGGPVALVFQLPDACAPATLSRIAAEAATRGAVLLVVQCLVTEAENEATLLANGFTYASSWYFGPVPVDSNEPTPAGIRSATAADVPRMLEIGERKREQYETFSPVFWKKAPTPRDEFAPYVISQVESPDNVALIFETPSGIQGYLIAQCRNKSEGYVDDYAIDFPESNWSVAGAALLVEASRQAAERNVETFAVVTGHADVPKRAAIESCGFTLRKNWFVLPLPAIVSPS